MPEGTKKGYNDDNVQRLMNGFDFYHQNTNVPHKRKFFAPRKVREKIYKTIPPSEYPEDQAKRIAKDFITGRTRMNDMSDIDNLVKIRKEMGPEVGDYYTKLRHGSDSLESAGAPREDVLRYWSDMEDKNQETVYKIEEEDALTEQISEGFGTHDEDMWKFYLGLPQSDNSVQLSKYKPTKSDNPKTTYYTLKDTLDTSGGEKYDWKEDIWMSILEHEKKGGKFPTHDIGGPSGLAHIKVDKGEDENGKYYSIYDKYDFGIPGEKLVGQPYEIYDRIYYDDSGEITNKTK
jgi:hypothetical protein